jgi:hypothetical protein
MKIFIAGIVVGVLATTAVAERTCVNECNRWGRLLSSNLNSTNLNLLTEIRVIGLQLMVKCPKSECRSVHHDTKELNEKIEILSKQITRK